MVLRRQPRRLKNCRVREEGPVGIQDKGASELSLRRGNNTVLWMKTVYSGTLNTGEIYEKAGLELQTLGIWMD